MAPAASSLACQAFLAAAEGILGKTPEEILEAYPEGNLAVVNPYHGVASLGPWAFRASQSHYASSLPFPERTSCSGAVPASALHPDPSSSFYCLAVANSQIVDVALEVVVDRFVAGVALHRVETWPVVGKLTEAACSTHFPVNNLL